MRRPSLTSPRSNPRPYPWYASVERREAVRQYDLAVFERGPNDVADERRPGREDEQELGLGGHLQVATIEHNLADRLTHGRASGFAGENMRDLAGSEP